MTGVTFDIQGRDDVGRWMGRVTQCPVCKMNGQLVARYRMYDPEVAVYHHLTWTQLRASSVIPDREIGITCGCYAKWQRQIAHIVDNTKH